MVKNPPSNAGDTGSIPGRGTQIPRAAEQLESPPLPQSPDALEPVLCSKRSPRATTRGSLSTAVKRPFTVKFYKSKKKMKHGRGKHDKGIFVITAQHFLL